MSETKLPSIPSLQGLPAALQKVLAPIKSIIEQRTNGPAALRWVSRGDLGDAIDDIGGGSSDGGIDYSAPPQPTGLVAFGTFDNIFLEWDPPPYANHAYTEIWRAAVDDLGQAVAVGASGMNVNLYVDPVDDGSTYYYWIRFVSRADVPGPYNATAGTIGETSATPTRILDALVGNLAEIHLVDALANDIDLLRGERVIKVDVDGRVVGIGMAVVNGESGPSGDLVIYADRFAVVTPAADPGEIPTVPFVVGNVNGVSTVGVNGQLVVDGSIYGYSIAADQITADHISVLQLSAISADMGTVTAGTFRTAASPAYRVEITSEDAYPLWYGSGAKNATNGILYVDLLGNTYIGGNAYIEGAAVVGGTLYGVDGTFDGTLTANAVNAVSTINLAGNAVVVTGAQSISNVAAPYIGLSATNWASIGQAVVSCSSGATKAGRIFAFVTGRAAINCGNEGGGQAAHFRIIDATSGQVIKSWMNHTIVPDQNPHTFWFSLAYSFIPNDGDRLLRFEAGHSNWSNYGSGCANSYFTVHEASVAFIGAKR